MGWPGISVTDSVFQRLPECSLQSKVSGLTAGVEVKVRVVW